MDATDFTRFELTAKGLFRVRDRWERMAHRLCPRPPFPLYDRRWQQHVNDRDGYFSARTTGSEFWLQMAAVCRRTIAAYRSVTASADWPSLRAKRCADARRDLEHARLERVRPLPRDRPSGERAQERLDAMEGRR